MTEIERRIPAERYVLVDDKPRILAATKDRLGARLVTVHVCQGKYAHCREHDRYPTGGSVLRHDRRHPRSRPR